MQEDRHSHKQATVEVVEEETVAHILCDCPAVRTKRLKYLGKLFFDNISELRTIEFKKFLRFVKEINFLGTEL
jgi:hypothetical protein